MMYFIILKKICLICLLFIAAGSCSDGRIVVAANQPSTSDQRMQQLFNEGNYKYEQQEFLQALALYRDIEEAGFASSELFLNTGLTYLQLQEGGYALYYFTKARQYSSGWDKAEEAITFTQNWLDQQQGRPPVLNTFRLYVAMQQYAGSGHAFLWAILLLNAAGALLLFFWFVPAFSRLRRTLRYTGAVLLGGVLLCVALGSYLQQSAANWKPGFVVESGYGLYASPEVSQEPRIALSSGGRIFLNERETRKQMQQTINPALSPDEPADKALEWLYVYHSSGIEGWVKAEAVRLL